MTGTPCAPVHDVLPPMLAAGYAVQQVLSARALGWRGGSRNGRSLSGSTTTLSDRATRDPGLDASIPGCHAYSIWSPRRAYR